MVTFPKYESYKNSGVEWLGEIPTNWNIERAKWLFQRMDRPVRKEDEVVTAFRDGEVTLRKNRREEGFTNALQEHGYQGIRKSDLVIHAMDAFAGAIGVSDSDGKSTPVYSVCTPRSEFYVNSYYYAYLLRYMARSGFIQSLAKGIRERSTDFRFNDFANLFLPIPTPEEQKRIVEFLDRKTSEIDQAIAQKQRLIELLQEQKAILINQAVTKGLDPNVPMCDQGVEWIGEIPTHWGVQPGRAYLKPQKVKNIGNKVSTVLSLSYGKIVIKPEEKLHGLVPESFETYQIVEPGNIIVRATDLQNDHTSLRIGLVEDRGIITSAYLCLVPSEKMDSRFAYYLLHMYDLLKVYYGMGSGLRQNLDYTDFKYLPLLIPKIEEQKSIAKFIARKTAETDQAITHERRFIKLLQEQKNIFVSQAVTGKIKV